MNDFRRRSRRLHFEGLEDRRLLTSSPTLVGAHAIYNNSAFDGYNATAGASDDGAVAFDKSWLLPGQTATFANYTGYDKGLNALAIDVVNPGPDPAIGDFSFKTGTGGDPAAWAAAPAPLVLDVRRGAGAGGADRLTLLWADGAIKNSWLQVTLLATGNVFYFGNAVGDTGNSPGNAFVSGADEIGVRTHATGGGPPADVVNVYDFNRDGGVDATDEAIARDNRRLFSSALDLISAPHVAALNIVASSDSPTVGLAGEVIHYGYKLYNTGSLALSFVEVTANLASTVVRQADLAGDGDGLLEAGEIWSYTGSFTVTQANLNAGLPLVNTVTATSSDTSADQDVATATIAPVSGDVFGSVVIRRINHASFVMNYHGKTIYVDPVGGAAIYSGIPAANYILITHIHGDHFDQTTINAIADANVKIIAPQSVYNSMSAALKAKTTVIDYSAGTMTPDNIDQFDELSSLLFNVQAVPAYNANHPLGAGNGYIVSIDSKRIYISGDTGAQSELRNLQNIDIAFLCMNTPFTMTVADAASLVRDMRPKVVYPYHYRNQDGSTGNAITFKNLMSNDFSIEVRLRKWY